MAVVLVLCWLCCAQCAVRMARRKSETKSEKLTPKPSIEQDRSLLFRRQLFGLYPSFANLVILRSITFDGTAGGVTHTTSCRPLRPPGHRAYTVGRTEKAMSLRWHTHHHEICVPVERRPHHRKLRINRKKLTPKPNHRLRDLGLGVSFFTIPALRKTAHRPKLGRI